MANQGKIQKKKSTQKTGVATVQLANLSPDSQLPSNCPKRLLPHGTTHAFHTSGDSAYECWRVLPKNLEAFSS